MKTIRSLLVAPAFAYVLLCALLYIFQQDFLYFPTPKYNHPYQVQVFSNDSESIEVIILNKGKENGILYFGGNGEAVVNNASDYMNDFPNHTVYLVNYRGYGGSSGSPNEEGIYSDALHIYDKIKPKHKGISIIGRSLGSGVASYIASKRSVEKISLITPYDSIESLAKSHYPIFPVSLLLKDKYNSIGRVNSIKAQVLVIIAEHDQVIPLQHSQNLINAFPPSQIKVATIGNTGHNSISESKEYHTLLRTFM